MKKQLQGIALLLFGILLCMAEEWINYELLRSISDMPIVALALICGGFGLYTALKKDGEGKS